VGCTATGTAELAGAEPDAEKSALVIVIAGIPTRGDMKEVNVLAVGGEDSGANVREDPRESIGRYG
jgi:hypothetical protein